MLSKSPRSTEEIVEALPGYTRDHVVQYLRWKLDLDELRMDDKLKITLPGFDDNEAAG